MVLLVDVGWGDAMAVYEVEILNWEKFNPRKDVKATSWFRMENSWITDPDFFDLTDSQKLVWIFLLSEASKRREGTLKICSRQAGRILNTRRTVVERALKIFEARGFIRSKILSEEKPAKENKRLRKSRVTRTSRRRNADVTLRTDERTNETDETNTESEKKSVTYSPAKEKSPDELIAEQWLEYAKKEMPWSEPPDGWTVENFAKDIAKVREATNLNEQGISEVLKFVSYDEFWRDKALSPGGLLKRSDRNGQRKIDNILLRMKPKESKSDRVLREYAEDTTPLKETDGMPF